MSVEIDVNETYKQEALDFFTDLGLKANISHVLLPAGDYIVDNYSCFELKTVIDFISSNYDGRLDQQPQKMQQYARRFILVYGKTENLFLTPESIKYWNEYWQKVGRPKTNQQIIKELKSIFGRMVSLDVKWECPVKRFPSIKHAWRYIAKSQKYTMAEKEYKIASPLYPPNTSPRIKQLMGNEGIGYKTAKIIAELGSIKDISTKSISEIQSLKGIGKKIAEKIYWGLRS